MTLPAGNDTATAAGHQRAGALLFSVVVSSRGDPVKLAALLDALVAQTLPADRREILIVLDGVLPAQGLPARAAAGGAVLLALPARGGPGVARNHGAARACGEWLAFTEEDARPAPDWLEQAARRIAREPALDVIAGLTVRPDGRRLQHRADDAPLYRPANLFVKRAAFERAGGYCADYFDAARGTCFREDADFGFTLEALGARIAHEPGARVVRPDPYEGYLGPLRWAQRHEMDALLERRHPQRFRERIEVHRLGPFTIRRAIVRASVLYVLALLLGAATAAAGLIGTAAWFAGFALLMFLVVWSRWRFDPLRLPVCLLVPFALVRALLRGYLRRIDSPQG